MSVSSDGGTSRAHAALQTGVNLLRNQKGVGSRVRWVERKSLTARLEKKSSPSWRTWSFGMRLSWNVAFTAETIENAKAGSSRFPCRIFKNLERDERNGPRIATLVNFQN